MIRAFADNDEYRAAIDARVSRFMGMYPQLKRGAFVIGIGVLVIATAALAALGVEKVVILTCWLVWFAIVVGYLVITEYLFDYLSHLVSLETMSYDEMRVVYAQRNQLTSVQPIFRGLGLGSKRNKNADAANRGNAPVQPAETPSQDEASQDEEAADE